MYSFDLLFIYISSFIFLSFVSFLFHVLNFTTKITTNEKQVDVFNNCHSYFKRTVDLQISAK